MTLIVDLMREIITAQAHPSAAALVAPLGLNPETGKLIGVTTVRPDSDGLYIPDADGAVTAAILPVMPNGDLIDLVAINIAQPGRWRRRTGLGDLLGENNVFGLFGEPLLVHPGPHEWLLADGEGVAVIEFLPSVRNLLNNIAGGLYVDDAYPDFAKTLEQELDQPARRPSIYLRHRRAA